MLKTPAEPAAARSSHRSQPSTRRDWLLHAGAGFGGLALLDLLSRDLAAGPEPSSRVRRQRLPGGSRRRPGA